MMNTMMTEMMNKMMAEMMPKMMETMMASMMSAMMGEPVEVANAEVTKPVKKTMSKEEFFALDSDEPKFTKDYSHLDFEPVNAKALKYNAYVPSDIWTINHLAITKNYGGRWSAKLKAYVFESHADAVNFAQSYKIKTQLDDTDRHNIKVYKAERAKAKAEYYAKKAENC